MATTTGPVTHGVQSTSTSTFISMSLDIHILVLQHLDPPDIVSFRKTCKILLDATHQRIVWINALKKMCLENTVYLHSYPVADMSIPELEYAASTPERWNRYIRKHKGEKDFTPSPLMRTLLNPDDYWHPSNLAHSLTFAILEQLYLVPGGRFLVTLSQSRIYVWDLGIAGITEPKSEPISEIPSQGQWFSTHPSLDGEGLRIITSDQYYGDASHCFEVFEIFPWKPDAELKRIATLNVETQQGLDLTSVVGDLLILVCGSILKLWNFATNGWATWNTGKPSKQV
ncbi:hypothetical protein BJ912DRAFT_379127 [Pholiota molesta]|nr:hypothetical protein BJ912DRAFT_379127 [Pholiota molesta]